MYSEIQEAVNFIARFLYGKIPRRKVCLFVEQLANFLVLKYQDHWCVDEPHKEAQYRTLSINVRGKSEQLLAVAASSVGLELDEIMQYMSPELTIWVNPGEVLYRLGDTGTRKMLYSATDVKGTTTLNKLMTPQGPQGDCANLKLNLNTPISSNWLVSQVQGTSAPVFELATPNDFKFTVGSFALTRFGTSKQKTNLALLKQIQRKAALAAVTADPCFGVSSSQMLVQQPSPSSHLHHPAMF